MSERPLDQPLTRENFLLERALFMKGKDFLLYHYVLQSGSIAATKNFGCRNSCSFCGKFTVTQYTRTAIQSDLMKGICSWVLYVSFFQMWLTLLPLLMREECQRKYKLDTYKKNCILKVKLNIKILDHFCSLKAICVWQISISTYRCFPFLSFNIIVVYE